MLRHYQKPQLTPDTLTRIAIAAAVPAWLWALLYT